MAEPTLVIMAAGMGSRFGGLKQITSVDDLGHAIIDFSLFDARRAGFKKIAFIIKHEIEDSFRDAVGRRMEKYFDVQYVYQQLDMLPEGYRVPEGREKPWGTGHAVLCCREFLDAPFLVINADDYYGAGAFKLAYEYLRTLRGKRGEYFMVGYALKNTLTENGYVSRGVCTVNEFGFLKEVRERTHIIASCDGPLFTEDGEMYRRLPDDTTVSMNCWGFTPDFLDALAEGFVPFLNEAMENNPMKAEYYLPTAVSRQLDRHRATARVLTCPDRWYGVTSHEDRGVVAKAMLRKAEEGEYPRPLWGKK